MTRQLEAWIRHLSPESIDLDVGGDILARGDEPTLPSPLAEALALAARRQVDGPVRLLIAGPGLDGEIPADRIRGQLGPWPPRPHSTRSPRSRQRQPRSQPHHRRPGPQRHSTALNGKTSEPS
ncbi:DUF1152 domain-containing protein [Streptomyces sp. NPDC006923]|uniref:DUF1152 domain-containing protein n=1 Tax=Streptomyces sp. NPDC006923 TaxID=3155355 RepID=UPI0033CC36D8